MPPVPLSELIAGGQSGRLVSFPTDTVPALAVQPDRAHLIFEAKQRSQTKPLILMAADSADLWDYVQGSEAEFAIWQRLASCYWPGALTLVLPASDRLPAAMNPLDPTTIGIRVPNQAVARYILSQTRPLATTSVNRTGQPPLKTIAEINAQFPEILTLLPEELAVLEQRLMPNRHSSSDRAIAESGSGVPSTVIKWTGSGWEVIRQGRVALDAAEVHP